MKSYKKPVLGWASYFVVAASLAHADESLGSWDVSTPLVTVQDTWLRALPRSDAEQALALPEGADGLQSVGCIDLASGSWCLVETIEGPGWVEARLLAKDTEGGGTAEDSELPPQGRVVVGNVSTRLNVRSGPGTDASVVDRLQAGTVLSRGACQDGPTYRWCPVSRPGEDEILGWVAEDFLLPANARSLAQAETFDRIGQISCRIIAQDANVKCPYGVAYGDRGTAALTVFLPNDDVRLFDFYGGRFVLTNMDAAEREAEMTTVNSSAGTTVIDVGSLHFVIPDSMITAPDQTSEVVQ